MASSESERSRLRRMPCSTCTRARAAPSIQSTLRPSARRSSSALEVEVADERGVPATDQQQIFDQAAQRAQQVDGLFLPVGAGAVAFRGVKELRVIRFCPRGPRRAVRSSTRASWRLARYAARSMVSARPTAPSASRAARARSRAFNSGRRRASSASSSAAGSAPSRCTTARERMVGSSSWGFSVSRISEVCSGGSSSSFKQAVGRFLHELRAGEDGECALGLDGRPVIGHVNRLPHLAQLDEQLRRVRRDDEHVGVGLDQDAGLALVGVAQFVAGRHGLLHALFQVGCLGNARAVGADAAEVG